MHTVAILICTFDRPQYLGELLTALTHEVSTAPCRTLSVIVIDNGTKDVRSLVDAFQARLPVEYVRLPNSGLVGARNASLRHGLRHRSDYLVFIDDDEVPEVGWLAGLLSAMTNSGAGFAVGPVKPRFSKPPPSWAPEFFTKTGEAFCTSNLIIKTCVVPPDEREWFQPRFSSTGGEDGEFLSRIAGKHLTHTIAHDAKVLENIPPDRVTVRYLWRSGYRDGVVASMKLAGNSTGKVLRSTVLGIGNICHGLNHLLWSAVNSRRFYRAVDDLSTGLGLIFGSVGSTIRFYDA